MWEGLLQGLSSAGSTAMSGLSSLGNGLTNMFSNGAGSTLGEQAASPFMQAISSTTPTMQTLGSAAADGSQGFLGGLSNLASNPNFGELLKGGASAYSAFTNGDATKQAMAIQNANLAMAQDAYATDKANAAKQQALVF